jgi:eukaryotic-like serine/threonine-protein kinase
MRNERSKQERWQQIEDLYRSASQQDKSRRAAYLAQACAGDASLELEVASLLAESDSSDGFLKEPAMAIAASELAKSSAPSIFSGPSVIGRYRIIRLIGEGGMGAVYEAEQEEPRRIVAVKMLRFGLATPDHLRRFRLESQALARLQHPGIAQIYESNTTDTGFGPQPYFAMELIRGLPLNEYAEAQHLNTRKRLALMVKVCEAVHHAHQRGLIHRDLKPGNILVDELGQPKILDFGVARLAQRDTQEADAPLTTQTDLGQIVGTLAYMSPEQVLGDPLEVDTRSDVYALGVILYELLCGRPPYAVNHRQLPEAVQTIRNEEPTSLSRIDRNYRGDIETIAKKALEKDKSRRYASAADFGADIQRYLNDEPITARPPSTVYQLRKFARRNRGLMAAIAAVLLVLLAGIAAATWMAVRARRAEAEAEAVNDFLQTDLLEQAGASAQAGPNANPDPHLEVRTALDRAGARISGKFEKQPLVEASIRQTIGVAYQDLGLFNEAQQQLERALAIRERMLGDNDPATWKSMDSLAVLYRLEGKYALAEPLRKKLLDARRRSLGERNPDTLDAMNNLALLYRYEGKRDLAEPLYVTALDGLRKLKGADRQMLTTMANLAQLYQDQGKYSRADQLYNEALKAAPGVFGAEHPSTLVFMSNLAQVYLDEGRFAEAESLQKKAAETDARILGAEHPYTLMDLGNLAKIYQNEHKYKEADAVLRRVLDVQRRVSGNDRPDTLTTTYLLGTVKFSEGEYANAEQLLTQALIGERRLYGTESPTTFSDLIGLGRAQLEQRKYDLAEANFREALKGYEKVRPGMWQRYNSASLLGQSLLAERKYAQAEPLLLSGYQGLLQRRDKISAPNRPYVASAGARIVRLYVEWGQPKKAEEWRNRLQTDQSTPSRAQ